MIGEELFHSENEYGDASNVHRLFLCPKVIYCVVINKMGFVSEKNTFKGLDQEISGVRLKDFLDLERGQTAHNKSKLKWKRQLQHIKVPHRGNNFENCLEDEKRQSCVTDPKMNCFDSEIAKSSKDGYEKITHIKTYSTEINKVKKQPPNENGYMLPQNLEKVVENVIL